MRSAQAWRISIQPDLLPHCSSVFTWVWLSKTGRCKLSSGRAGVSTQSSVTEPWAGQTGLMEPSPYMLCLNPSTLIADTGKKLKGELIIKHTLTP